MISDNLIKLDGGFLHLDNWIGSNSYRCRFVKAGRIKMAGGFESDIEVLPEALIAAVDKKLFDNCASFIDHAGFFENPSLRNLVGVTSGSFWNPADLSVDGSIRFYESFDANTLSALLNALLIDEQMGEPVPDIGLSIVFWPIWKKSDVGATGQSPNLRIIEGIRHVESVDFVFQPAADGRVLEALTAIRLSSQALSSYSDVVRVGAGVSPAQAGVSPAQFNTLKGGNSMDESQSIQPVGAGVTPAQPVQEEVQPRPSLKSDAGLASAESWISAVAETAKEAIMLNSGLPPASRDKLLKWTFTSPAELQVAIQAEQDYLAALKADEVVQIGGVPPRSPQISMGRTSLEKVQLAFEALMSGRRPTDGIQPLTGLRELYNLLSGDYELTGMFQPERVMFANVTCATMSNMVANVLNKIVMQEFQEYPQWWNPVVTQEDFATLQDIRWITLGGVGELPTVAEGATYTELTWDDKYESSSFVKKGGYLGITIEAIDKDDTSRLRAAPRALAQAAWLTLNKAISAIFTVSSGVGPTLIDTLALFHTTHANLGTTALSLTTWNAARIAMRKQTEVNSGERLGALCAPRFLLVPPDLEVTALQVLGSDRDYIYALANAQAAPLNVNSEGDALSERLRIARERVIVVDLWTDTNDWAACADPKLYPTIGLGFRYGRQPEIFSVASPTAGLMFTNDTMPVKVRFFFATGPVDYRGLYKANVA